MSTDADGETAALADFLGEQMKAAEVHVQELRLIAQTSAGQRRTILQKVAGILEKDIASKRRILSEYANAVRLGAPCAHTLASVLYTLAATYDDRDGYKEEWRP